MKPIFSKELKPLNELLDLEFDKNYSNSLIMTKRCAAIYGALYFIHQHEIDSEKYENRYKIFLQTAVIEDIKLNGTNENDSYKKQIEEFKSSLTFFIQILLQNHKKNNSFLKNHWIEKDLEICEKY